MIFIVQNPAGLCIVFFGIESSVCDSYIELWLEWSAQMFIVWMFYSGVMYFFLYKRESRIRN